MTKFKLALAAVRYSLKLVNPRARRWAAAAKTLMSFAANARGDVLILTHVNADPDAVASAVILASLLKRLGLSRASLAFPEGPSKVSKRVLSGLKLRVRYFEEPPRQRYTSVAVVDAANSNQLGAFRRVVGGARELLLIDHHLPPGDLVQRSRYRVLAPEPATTLIVCGIAQAVGAQITGDLATLALTGILFDTRRFIHVTPHALQVTAQLIERGAADYQKALSLLETEEDFSERVAKLKGAARCHVIRYGDFLVAVTEIGSFEASVARALLSLGADAALVASERDGECRLSIRLSRSFHLKTGLSAGGDLASALAERLNGKGGGHAQAGTFKGRCSASEALREALQILGSALGAKARRVT